MIGVTTTPIVEPVQQLSPRGLRVTVTYRVTPGEPARVENFDIQVTGFDDSKVSSTLTLQRQRPVYS